MSARLSGIHRRCGPLLVLTLTLGACASLPVVAPQRGAQDVLGAVAAGEVSSLQAASRTPFLLDAEILQLDSDVARLWEALTDPRLALAPIGQAVQLPGPAAAAAFGQTMDVTTFFARHVPASAVAVRVPTSAGDIVLLIGQRTRTETGRLPAIHGFAGPEGQ